MELFMKKILVLTGALFFSLLPLSACNEDDGVTTIKLNEVTHSVFYAPLYLADELGYFAEENIEIELVNGGGADNVMAAVLSEDADIGFCGPEPALYVQIGGSTDVPTVFGQLTKRDGSFLVSRIDEPNFAWTDLNGKEILAGRDGGVPAMTFEYVLNNHSLYDGENVFMNFDVDFNLMVSAFETGTADYCTMFEPTASEYEKAGKGYVVASVGEESGEIPYTCFIAKQSWLKSNEETVVGFLRAILKAVDYAVNTDAEEIATHLYAQFPSTSYASISTSVESYQNIDSWQTDLIMSEDSFDRLQDVIENAGKLDRRGNYETLVDHSFVQKAIDSLK